MTQVCFCCKQTLEPSPERTFDLRFLVDRSEQRSAEKEHQHGYYEEYDEKNLGHASCCSCDSCESKERGDKRDDEKNHSPSQHLFSPLAIAAFV